jgi:hypothetical protein
VIPTQSISPSTSPQQAKRMSIRSSRSGRDAVEYEIWRKWDDCLDFQRTLEVEYHAVSKRRRKGEPALNHHAKNMLYPSQRAASFESLPLGPDPSTIPVDVHAHIPKLSKKSTLFRVNESVIHQRGEEFKAMIEALFDEDAPSTLQELRTVGSIRDFFGYWRRDKDAERKMGRTPTFDSATSLPPHQAQAKGGDRDPPKHSSLKQSSPKQPGVLTPELIAFTTGGSIAGPSKPKRPSTGRSSHTTSTGSRDVQQAVLNSAHELGRPSMVPYAPGIPPSAPFSASAIVATFANEEPHRRVLSPSRPVEGAVRADPLLLRSLAEPSLVNAQSKTPVFDSRGPYMNPPASPYGDGFSRLRQRSSPQILNLRSAESNPSLPVHDSTPVGSVFNHSLPFAHPMQGRTASMPSQRREGDGQVSPSTRTPDQVLPGPIPRRRNGTIDMSGNRTARFFDVSTDIANDPPLKSPLDEEDGARASAGHLQGLSQRSSRSQMASSVQTVSSTGQSTSTGTSQSSHRSSAAAPQRHRTAPSWSSRRMSLDSLAPIDLGHYSSIGSPPPSLQVSVLRAGHLDGNDEMDKSRPYVTQDPRHSVSSDSSYGDEAAQAQPPSASVPSSVIPLKIPPSSAVQSSSLPPPRPPRSALRTSGVFSSGKRISTASSPAASLLTPAEDGGAAVPVDIEPHKRASTSHDDVVDSYFEMPSHARSGDPFELEFRPQPLPLPLPPPAPVYRARARANSAGTGLSMSPIVVPPLPSFLPPDSLASIRSSEAVPASPATPYMGPTTTIKAVHEASNTILLFRVSRMSTSLVDLRVKLSRKFMEAENIRLNPERLELRYLAPAFAMAPNIANRRPSLAGGPVAGPDGRDRCTGVNSIQGTDGIWLPLNTEADWHAAAATASGKVTVKVF